MSFALLTIVLAIGWAVATGSFTILNLILGAAVGAAALLVIRTHVTKPPTLARWGRMLSLAGLFIVQLFLSAIRVAALVLQPNLRARLRPGIVAFPLTVSRDAEITLLANMITLTPGTLSIDVSDDRKVLYVHAIDVVDRETLIRSIAGGFERKIIEAFE